MTLRWEECALIQYIFKYYNEQDGEREGGKGRREKTLSEHQDGLDTTDRGSNTPPDNKIRGKM